jgi:hypothetical protein
MMKRTCALSIVFAVLVASAQAGVKDGLKKGTPQLKSVGPLAFGPEGLLFIGDTKGAAIFAIDTNDSGGNPSKVKHNVSKINEKIAALLGTTTRDVSINDVAVNPASGNVYLSVSRGRGPDAIPVLIRVDGSGKLSEVSLKNVRFAKAELTNVPEDKETGQGRRRSNKRQESITDLAYVDGRVFVAGLSNEEFASKLRALPFPFKTTDAGTSVEIFHGAHGRFETRSPVRTFALYKIEGKQHLLAAYTCTPLVKFPVSDLKPGQKIQGTTIAELGNRNRPLDMVVYNKGGKNYLLLANSSRGVMKITTEGIGTAKAITSRAGGPTGQSYDTIAELKGIMQLDRLNDKNAVVLVQADSGALNLETIALP